MVHTERQRGIKKKRKRERVGIIKAVSCRAGFEYARRSPGVECVYRRPGLLKQESLLLLLLLQFTHSQLSDAALVSWPRPLLHTSLHYPRARLESANVCLKCRYRPVCPSLSVCLFSSGNQRKFSNTVSNLKCELHVVAMTSRVPFGQVK